MFISGLPPMTEAEAAIIMVQVRNTEVYLIVCSCLVLSLMLHVSLKGVKRLQ